MQVAELGFPVWLRINHFVNFLFITLLVRSGIQILSDHPKLYWNDHCHPGSEWLRFGMRRLPEHALWTSMDEAVEVSPLLAIPGERHALGSGRHWHFVSVIFWLLNGFIYVALLFCTDNWRRLIPTSWSIIPAALHDLIGYLTFHTPPLSDFHPYDPLQQLAYASVVFILAPLTILSGLAMSPAISGRFPWYTQLFFGHQKARSVHFLCMIAYLLFLVVHVSLVFLVYFKRNVLDITFGDQSADFTSALALFFGGITFVILVNWLATIYTRKNKRMIQDIACALLEPTRRAFFRDLYSNQSYTEKEISPYFRVNGRPPETEEFLTLLQGNFKDYRLKIEGLVECPMEFSIDDLKNIARQSQITKHVCIQGWTAIGQWAGVPVSAILEKVRPLPTAQRVFFHSFQLDPKGIHYYNSLGLDECQHPKTILAYEMNHESLPVEHGAPLRLRIETKLGFTMCKWVQSMQFVASMKDVGLGHGGYREDYQYFGTEAQI